MTISKDQLAFFDPAIEKVSVVHGRINLQVAYNTSVLTFTESELHLLTKELQETK